MAVSFTVSTKMLPFKRLSWLWIVFQIVVVVNVNPLVSRRGEYKEYVHCISVEGYFVNVLSQIYKCSIIFVFVNVFYVIRY